MKALIQPKLQLPVFTPNFILSALRLPVSVGGFQFARFQTQQIYSFATYPFVG